MEERKAKKVYTLPEITFNEANKVMAILACIPIVGLILLFVEKNDLFVRYYAAQYTIVGALAFVVSLLSGLLLFLALIINPLLWLGVTVLVIVGMVKASQGQKFDIPMISEYALKLMSVIE